MFYAALSEFPILALASLGFYIAFRFLQFPDLTVDAAFMVGMSLVGMIVHNQQGYDLYALGLAPISGALLGCITGLLHTSRYLGINKFLAGMLVSFGAYSICFRMCGSSQVSLYVDRGALLSNKVFNTTSTALDLTAMIGFTGILYLIVSRLFSTPLGLAIRSVGQRPGILTVSGQNSKLFLILGLAFANSLTATAGWLEAVTRRNVSLVNFGIVINVLAAVLLGDFLRYSIFAMLPFKWRHRKTWLPFMLLSPLAGALLYSLIKSFVIKVLSGQLTVTLTTDLQFIIALCMVLSIFAGRKLGNRDLTDEEES